MRIVRYELAMQEYQQVQPLWPGHVLSVGKHEYDHRGDELELSRKAIDMWCIDNDERRGDRLPPILGVWIIGTGNPIPPALIEADALFHGTVDMRPYRGAWHVFSAVVGLATGTEPPERPEYGSVDAMVERIKARRGRA